MKSKTIKRLGDWLEKISAGAMLIGIYKETDVVITVTGIGLFIASIYVTRFLNEGE